MWRPEEIGTVIAERRLDLFRGRKRLGRATVRLGLPVREPSPDASAPWFCPLSVSGAGIRLFKPVAGADSFQALVLAMELATTLVPLEAARVGARAEWLQDEERLVFARHTLALGADNAIIALLGRLRQAAAILDPGTATSLNAKRRAHRALDAIGESVGGRIGSRVKARKALSKRKTRT